MIQHGQVPADQSAFPVLLTEATLPAEILVSGGANAAQADGGDIRFSSDSTGATQLACEIAHWDQTAGTAEIWVPVSILTASDVTIWVWYHAGGGQSQPAVGAAFGAEAVYDANFKSVWHLSTGSPIDLHDSTASVVTASNNNGATSVAGKIDGGAGFASGSSQNLTAASAVNANAETLSAWFQSSTTGVYQDILRRDNGSTARYWLLRINDTNHLESGLLWGGFAFTTSAATVTDGAWHLAHLVFSYDGVHSNGVLYLDGVAVGSAMQVTGVNTTGDSLGVELGGYVNGGEYLNGSLDEARIHNANRSANWVLTEYHNQNAPGSFVIAGTPVSTGAVSLFRVGEMGTRRGSRSVQ